MENSPKITVFHINLDRTFIAVKKGCRSLLIILYLKLAVLILFLTPTAVAADSSASLNRSNTLESRTEQYLERIESSLEKRLKSNKPKFSDSLRNHFINFSMLGPMADISGWTLEKLGDSKTARTYLFFVMPVVRWMSKPFLFPVETQGTSQETEREIRKLFNFIAELNKQGFSASLDNVGDASFSPERAKAYGDYYLSLIRQFAGTKEMNELCMSLKLSALTYDLDAAVGTDKNAIGKQEEIKEAIVEMLRAASEVRGRRIFIRIDMEEYAYKALTLRLFREIVEQNENVAVDDRGRLRLGVVIQAYLRDGAKDVRDLGVWAARRGFRVPIRLVKGAYLKYEREIAKEKGIKCPVWNHKPSTDANYEAICGFMLKNLDVIEPAFATHNIRSQAHVMAVADLYHMGKSSFEFQMLYGMGDTIKDVVVNMGYPMREYIPSGSLARGLKYAGRRFCELASGDNALARTMRGDFSVIDDTPAFQGAEDQEDGRKVMALISENISDTANNPKPASLGYDQ